MTWRVIFAFSAIIIILTASYIAAAYVGVTCSRLEILATEVIDSAEQGNEALCTAKHMLFKNNFSKLHGVLVFTANHFDFNNAELSYDRLWEYVKAGEFFEAKAELASLHNALLALQVAESLALPNVL